MSSKIKFNTALHILSKTYYMLNILVINKIYVGNVKSFQGKIPMFFINFSKRNLKFGADINI